MNLGGNDFDIKPLGQRRLARQDEAGRLGT
jgi:hypothetical protein